MVSKLKIMNEKNLEDIGFIKYHDETETKSPYYYWAYDFKTESGISSLLTQASDELKKKEGWEVVCPDWLQDLKFTSLADLITFINVVERNIK